MTFNIFTTKRVSRFGQYDRIDDLITCKLSGDKRPVHRQTRGQASTEELRQAMLHYRTLFDELVGVPEMARAKAAS